jgi:hypothetical protein
VYFQHIYDRKSYFSMSDPSPDAVKSDGKSVGGKKNQGGRCHGASRAHTKSKFEGEIPELKGHVYDCIPNRQADLYLTTTRRIADYFVNKHSNAGDFRVAMLDTLTLPTVPAVPRPVAPPGEALDE